MPITQSVIISCAGFGSRLGLGTTKALIKINGKSLIRWQLEQFNDVEDVRVVVGFQAQDVIDEVLSYRKDVIFVYNHSYFETKTGASYYLGARHGNEYAFAYDGDLLVHPDDLKMLLHLEGEWIAYADKISDDSVYVRVNEQGEVVAFSREQGDYEWTGPCVMKKSKLQYNSGNVYNLLEPHLPMRGIKVRACDIDTFDDYQRAIVWVHENFVK